MSAVISECKRYRYRLEREISSGRGKVIAFFGINPSTADEKIDDNTIKRLKAIAAENGASILIVGNVFAYRATDVRVLGKVHDPFGEDNRKHLKNIIQEADILVPFWGSKNKLPTNLRHYLDDLLKQLLMSGKPVKSLGLTVSGDPRHTQGCSAGTPLTLWEKLIKK